jgi:hypothetical protein
MNADQEFSEELHSKLRGAVMHDSWNLMRIIPTKGENDERIKKSEVRSQK